MMTHPLDAIVTGPADRFYPRAEIYKLSGSLRAASPVARPLCADHTAKDHPQASSARIIENETMDEAARIRSRNPADLRCRIGLPGVAGINAPNHRQSGAAGS